MIFLLLTNIKASCILTLFNQANEDVGYTASNVVLFFLLFTGLFISIIGVRKMTSCIFLLLLIAFEVFFKKMRDYIAKLAEPGNKEYFGILQSKMAWLDNLITHNGSTFGIAVIILCLVVAYFCVSFFKAISTFGFLIVLFYLYQEGFHEQASLKIGITNQYVLWGLYIVFTILLYLAFKKLPYLVMSVFFGITGPMITIGALESLLNVDFGFNKLRKNIEESNFDGNNKYHTIAFLIICVIDTMYQAYSVFKK